MIMIKEITIRPNFMVVDSIGRKFTIKNYFEFVFVSLYV